ncbi:hypothetical protein EON66_12345 [archaeon]|nr:MAG: hypothetical protein EON66_12345 [archaeon]
MQAAFGVHANTSTPLFAPGGAQLSAAATQQFVADAVTAVFLCSWWAGVCSHVRRGVLEADALRGVRRPAAARTDELAAMTALLHRMVRPAMEA